MVSPLASMTLLLFLIQTAQNIPLDCGAGDCTCTAEEDCVMNCNIAEGDCQGGTLTCKDGYACTINCENKNACESSTINAGASTIFALTCQGGTNTICSSATVNCGTSYCTVNCVSGGNCAGTFSVDDSTANGFSCTGSRCPLNTPFPQPTSAVTLQPTTATPTTAMPTTDTPTTYLPTTNNPTTAPSTSIPTAAPMTAAPSTSIPTDTPTTYMPTTNNPTAAPTSVNQTNAPTTMEPTGTETTVIYTTDSPTTHMPTQTPTTEIPTTYTPTTAPTGPTTAAPTIEPTIEPTTYPTIEPTTSAPTTEPTTPVTTESEEEEEKRYPSGINGLIMKAEDWANTEATQAQLLMVVGGFGVLLICCLCFFNHFQTRKTKKLRQVLKSDFFSPEQKQANKPYMVANVSDSINNHAPAAEAVAVAVAANNGHSFADHHNHNIPIEVENKLEESLSVESGDKALDMFGVDMTDMAAPPPPSEPVPEDILQRHRSRTQTQNKGKGQSNAVEMQPMADRRELHRIASVSHASDTLEESISIGIEDNKGQKRNNNDPALALLSDTTAVKEKIDVNNSNNANESKVSSIEAEFKALSTEIDHKPETKPKAEQSGNDIILGMFDSGSANEKKSEPKSEEKANDASHRGKQDVYDPFASMDMANPVSSFASVPAESKDKDSEAMGVLGGLLSANPEFGTKDNIFGGTAENATEAILNSSAPTSNIIDFNKYASVEETVSVDYDKLTKISDTDQYKVVSVKETVIVEDGNGNVQESVDTKVNENDETTALDTILKENMAQASDNNVQIISEANANENESDPFGALNNDGISPLDNIMLISTDDKYNNMAPLIPLMNDALESKEEVNEEESQESNDEQSMGSEIIHDTPRVSAVHHQKLDSQIFGNEEESSSESEAYSNGTDPNAY